MKSLIISSFIGFIMLIPTISKAQAVAEISQEELPRDVQTILSKKYKKFTLNNLTKKESESNEISYELELQKKNRLIYLTYDSNGNLLSKRKSKSFTYDGTEPVRKTQPSHDGHNHTH